MDELRKIKLAYKNMKDRCYNPKNVSFTHYGARGIVVCDEWLNDRESFISWALSNGHDKSLSIDRIDVNGNYEPSNCRWATQSEQHNNERRNVVITYNGISKTLTEWGKELGKTESEIVRARKRYQIYKATTLDELFCSHLLTFRKSNERHKCILCSTESSKKWRIGLCANCYAKALRWSKKTGRDIAGYAELIVKELNKNTIKG